MRTTGSKLNHATHAVGLHQPRDAVRRAADADRDEVYALTAYVLNLNDIVPEDFALDEQNLLTLPMPNRDGFTRAHGMGAPSAGRTSREAVHEGLRA